MCCSLKAARKVWLPSTLLLAGLLAHQHAIAQSITYTFTLQNATALPQTTTILITDVITPLTGPYTVAASTEFTLTDLAGDGAQVTAAPPSGGLPVDTDGVDEYQANFLGNSGIWTNAGIDLGVGATLQGGTAGQTISASFSEGPVLGPVGGPFNGMRISLAVTLSPGDTFAFSGRFDIADAAAAVPEPGTMALLAGLGVSSLLAVRRVRRRSR